MKPVQFCKLIIALSALTTIVSCDSGESNNTEPDLADMTQPDVAADATSDTVTLTDTSTPEDTLTVDTSTNDLGQPPNQDTVHCIGVATGTLDNKTWVTGLDEDGDLRLVGHHFGDLQLGTFSNTTTDAFPDAYYANTNQDCEIESVTFVRGAGFEGITQAFPLPGGGVIASGRFTVEADFGNGVVLQGSEASSGFVAVWDEAGDVVSARAILPTDGGEAGASRMAMKSDGTSLIYVWFEGSLEDAAQTQLIPTTGRNGAVFSFDPSNDQLDFLTHLAGSDNYCGSWGFAVDPNTGGFYMGADFRGTCTVGDVTLTSVNSGGEGPDGYIMGFDADGTPRWSRHIHGGTQTVVSNLTVDPVTGDVFATGRIVGPTDFGDGDLSFIGGDDAFVVRYAADDGELVWRRLIGGAGDDWSLGPTTEPGHDSVLVTGNFNGSMQIDDLREVVSRGERDGFFLSVDLDTGTPRWIRSYGGSERERVYSAHHGPDDSVYLTGEYRADDVMFMGDLLPASAQTTFFWSRVTIED